MLMITANPDLAQIVYVPGIVQVTILMFSSLINLLYNIQRKPFVYPEMNYLEQANEFMVYSFSVSYMMLIKD